MLPCQLQGGEHLQTQLKPTKLDNLRHMFFFHSLMILKRTSRLARHSVTETIGCCIVRCGSSGDYFLLPKGLFQTVNFNKPGSTYFTGISIQSPIVQCWYLQSSSFPGKYCFTFFYVIQCLYGTLSAFSGCLFHVLWLACYLLKLFLSSLTCET